ncbi:hypothetical protein AB0F46_19835 [Streptomyces sp. NPDC026665]|uniref:hypothetical protein n=1 Tax=Streptomyces sp. NPDC026665 TaxID=3154798 RepID=UPI003409B280
MLIGVFTGGMSLSAVSPGIGKSSFSAASDSVPASVRLSADVTAGLVSPSAASAGTDDPAISSAVAAIVTRALYFTEIPHMSCQPLLVIRGPVATAKQIMYATGSHDRLRKS